VGARIAGDDSSNRRAQRHSRSCGWIPLLRLPGRRVLSLHSRRRKTTNTFLVRYAARGCPSSSVTIAQAMASLLVDSTSGEPFPCAPSGSVLLSSAPHGWPGIIVEHHLLEPQELPEHYVVGHGVSVSTSKQPIPFGWRGGKGWRAGVINPAEFHLLTHGEPNAPRWLQTFEQMSLVLDRRFVADVVREGLPAERIEFATQRSACDATIAHYARAFRSELVAIASMACYMRKP
jgi:hypothetical protein